MPAPTRSKYFQVHLSTAIVLMFLAGNLLWANLQFIRYRVDRIPNVDMEDVKLQGADFQYEIWGFGWPGTFHERFDDNYIFKTKPRFVQSSTHYTNYIMAVFDLAVAFFILVTVWFLCEWQIRLSMKNGT